MKDDPVLAAAPDLNPASRGAPDAEPREAPAPILSAASRAALSGDDEGPAHWRLGPETWEVILGEYMRGRPCRRWR
ncbi:hypothetical protein BH09PSE1_BH09PSE1_24380 [soil metagenome]